MRTSAKAGALVVLGYLLIGIEAAKGQGTASSVSGVIRDPQGRVIPGAAIALRNLATDIVRSTATDRDGRYAVLDLDPGSYELRAEKPGFRTEVQNPLTLAVAGTATVDLSLSLGSISQQIVVVSEGSLLERTEPNISRVVGIHEIQSQPN